MNLFTRRCRQGNGRLVGRQKNTTISLNWMCSQSRRSQKERISCIVCSSSGWMLRKREPNLSAATEFSAFHLFFLLSKYNLQLDGATEVFDEHTNGSVPSSASSRRQCIRIFVQHLQQWDKYVAIQVNALFLKPVFERVKCKRKKTINKCWCENVVCNSNFMPKSDIDTSNSVFFSDASIPLRTPNYRTNAFATCLAFTSSYLFVHLSESEEMQSEENSGKIKSQSFLSFASSSSGSPSDAVSRVSFRPIHGDAVKVRCRRDIDTWYVIHGTKTWESFISVVGLVSRKSEPLHEYKYDAWMQLN